MTTDNSSPLRKVNARRFMMDRLTKIIDDPKSSRRERLQALKLMGEMFPAIGPTKRAKKIKPEQVFTPEPDVEKKNMILEHLSRAN